MSTQLNFFGGWNAVQFIYQKLSECLGAVRLVEGVFEDLDGSSVFIESLIINSPNKHRGLVVLLSENVGGVEIREAPDGLKRIDLQNSLVVEWTPATLTDEIATVGRLYAATSDEKIRKPLNRVFASIKRECESFKYGHQYWVFPEAMQIPVFQGWIGKAFANPLITEDGSKSCNY